MYENQALNPSSHVVLFVAIIGMVCAVYLELCGDLVLATKHTLLHMFLIFGAKYCFQKTCMLFRISVQLSVKTFNCPRGLQLPVHLSILSLNYRAYPTLLF